MPARTMLLSWWRMHDAKLYDLIPMHDAAAVLDEAVHLCRRTAPGADSARVRSAHVAAMRLYQGHYPGYRACNTAYHDFQHISDTFIAMARLAHGAALEGQALPGRTLTQGLIAALFHDSGYIQEDRDRQGTGSKYTSVHVERSRRFLECHGAELGITDADITACCHMIRYTDIAWEGAAHACVPPEETLAGQLLGTSDLLAQMADRAYFEKLTLLYREFREGKVGGFTTAADLLRNTIVFYEQADARFAKTLGGANRFMRSHFAGRWSLDRDLYAVAIENAREYLKKIACLSDENMLRCLRRGAHMSPAGLRGDGPD
jgi:hypothetical protein